MIDKHTQGQMEVGGALEQNYIYVDGWHIGFISSADDCNGNDSFDNDSEAVANARRLAAGWNALSGISTQAIEAGAVAELVSAARSALPNNLYLTNRNIRDDMIVPLETTMGELRRLFTALANMGVKP